MENTGADVIQEPLLIHTNSIGLKLARIPAGGFTMGSPSSEKGSSVHEPQPEHRVKITQAFYMGIYPVTQGEFEIVMKQNPSQFKGVSGQNSLRFPADSVNWEEATEFCRKLSVLESEVMAGWVYHLPTEAQWEYACRAGTSTAFHIGNSLSSSQANFDGYHPYGSDIRGVCIQRPTAVGSYKANAFGLFDMHGNVQEWCADLYDKNYYKSSPIEDPPGPADGRYRDKPVRVLRGGGWHSIATVCRSGERSFDQPTRRYDDYGLRVICYVEPAKQGKK